MKYINFMFINKQTIVRERERENCLRLLRRVHHEKTGEVAEGKRWKSTADPVDVVVVEEEGNDTAFFFWLEVAQREEDEDYYSSRDHRYGHQFGSGPAHELWQNVAECDGHVERQKNEHVVVILVRNEEVGIGLSYA